MNFHATSILCGNLHFSNKQKENNRFVALLFCQYVAQQSKQQFWGNKTNNIVFFVTYFSPEFSLV